MKSLLAVGLAGFLGLYAATLWADTEATLVDAPSSTAQRLYAEARQDLLQIRVLVNNGRSQSSVGSGFLLGESDLVVTNYHVVSQIALEPDFYTGEYLDTQGRRGEVQLLAVDVLRDLAVVRIDRQGSGFFRLPDPDVALAQGEYLYALGNPLDLGFAISEGTYNGIIQRDFSDLLLFSGALNPGMSAGSLSARAAGFDRRAATGRLQSADRCPVARTPGHHARPLAGESPEPQIAWRLSGPGPRVGTVALLGQR